MVNFPSVVCGLGKPVQPQAEFDEFGRDRSMYMDQAKQRRVVERDARRNRRRRQREAARQKENDGKTYHEGLSSDDEEGSGDVLRFKSESGNTFTFPKATQSYGVILCIFTAM